MEEKAILRGELVDTPWSVEKDGVRGRGFLHGAEEKSVVNYRGLLLPWENQEHLDLLRPLVRWSLVPSGLLSKPPLTAIRLKRRCKRNSKADGEQPLPKPSPKGEGESKWLNY